MLPLLFLPLVFTSCSKDNEESEIRPVEKKIPELTLSQTAIEVEVEKNTTVEILTGGGEYGVFSSNPDIVTAEVTGNKISISALDMGHVSLVVSDENSQYKELNIKAFYTKIALEKEKVDIVIPLGHSRTVELPILKGNGGYEVTEESDIVEASIRENTLIIEASAVGEATLTLTDSDSLVLEVPVSISSTTIPYTKEELNEIMADDKQRYIFNGSSLIISSLANYYTYLYSQENGDVLIGWSLWSQYFKIYYQGDTSVGEKTGANLKFVTGWGAPLTTEEIKFEILKNDGNKIWGTYSYVKNDKLNFGHFCQNITSL